METLSFEKLPQEMANLRSDFKELKRLILQGNISQPKADDPLSIDEVSNLIGKSKPTIYGYVSRNKIPHSKHGGRLYFFKSEIIEWIKTGTQKTIKKLEAETDEFLSNRKKK